MQQKNASQSDRRILGTWRHCMYMVKIHHQFLSNYSKYSQHSGYKAFTETHKIKAFSKAGKEAPQNIKISLILLCWQQPVVWPSTPVPWPWVSTAAQSIHPTSEHTNGHCSSLWHQLPPHRVLCLALLNTGLSRDRCCTEDALSVCPPCTPRGSCPTDFPAQNEHRSPRKSQ